MQRRNATLTLIFSPFDRSAMLALDCHLSRRTPLLSQLQSRNWLRRTTENRSQSWSESNFGGAPRGYAWHRALRGSVRMNSNLTSIFSSLSYGSEARRGGFGAHAPCKPPRALQGQERPIDKKTCDQRTVPGSRGCLSIPATSGRTSKVGAPLTGSPRAIGCPIAESPDCGWREIHAPCH